MLQLDKSLTILDSFNKALALLDFPQIRLEDNGVAEELAGKRAWTSLHGSEAFCGNRNGHMAMTLKNEEERLSGLYGVLEWNGIL